MLLKAHAYYLITAQYLQKVFSNSAKTCYHNQLQPKITWELHRSFGLDVLVLDLTLLA